MIACSQASCVKLDGEEGGGKVGKGEGEVEEEGGGKVRGHGRGEVGGASRREAVI